MNDKDKKSSGIRTKPKYKDNPFLSQALERIQDNVITKYKNATNTGETAILQAVDNQGEILGHTSFVRQIQVDEEKFTKLYLAQFSAFWELPSPAIKVFGYIMHQLKPKNDVFMFFMDECLEYTKYTSEKSVYRGLASLIDADIIARGRYDTLYFINPMIAFNGDRVTFAKTYVKKQKPAKIDPNQTAITFESEGQAEE
jgi:hypothetical protein